MIFIKIRTEGKVQENDKTRIDISATFATNISSPISTYEIEPESGNGFIDVTSDMFLDWAYSTAGTKVITVRITQDDATETTLAADMSVVTAADDNLFSGDTDIFPLEPELPNWIQKGRNSYLDKHREAQYYILNDLDSARIWKNDGSRYEASDIVDIQEFKEWSKYETLRIIYEGISNDIGDIFSEKAKKYRGFAIQAKKRATFRLDSNGDGENTVQENVDNISGSLYRS